MAKLVKKPKIVVILGPTATGKSDLGVRLAKQLNGEIVSADSRQVYKGLNLGAGKITKKEMKGVKHHLLDVVSPKDLFTVSKYQVLAYKAIGDILRRGKLPIIVGGTGFYIQSIVDGLVLPDVPVNEKLRKVLRTCSTKKLASILKKLDSERYTTVDINNRVRLIRSIEIAKTLGKVPAKILDPKYDCVQIGVDLPDTELYKRISKRLEKRFDEGMINEVQKLLKKGISHKRLQELGLEYRHISLFLQKKMTADVLVAGLAINIRQFAKRQRQWFARDVRIKWFKPTEYAKILKKVKLKI